MLYNSPNMRTIAEQFNNTGVILTPGLLQGCKVLLELMSIVNDAPVSLPSFLVLFRPQGHQFQQEVVDNLRPFYLIVVSLKGELPIDTR